MRFLVGRAAMVDLTDPDAQVKVTISSFSTLKLTFSSALIFDPKDLGNLSTVIIGCIIVIFFQALSPHAAY